MTHNDTSGYIPGVCNIGPSEIKRRKRAGWTGLIATVIFWVVAARFDVAAAWRFLLFFPATMSSAGFLQAHMRFCAYFGFAALFNFGDDGKKDSVVQAEFRLKDKAKARQIAVYSVLIGVAVAALAYIL